jgi:hypothetical protein
MKGVALAKFWPMEMVGNPWHSTETKMEGQSLSRARFAWRRWCRASSSRRATRSNPRRWPSVAEAIAIASTTTTMTRGGARI